VGIYLGVCFIYFYVRYVFIIRANMGLCVSAKVSFICNLCYVCGIVEVEILEPHIFRWTIISYNRKIAWLWEALYHPSLETSSWSILKNLLLTWHSTHHHRASRMLITHLRSGLMAERGYRISSATSIV
jgi:hypothetical protein